MLQSSAGVVGPAAILVRWCSELGWMERRMSDACDSECDTGCGRVCVSAAERLSNASVACGRRVRYLSHDHRAATVVEATENAALIHCCSALAAVASNARSVRYVAGPARELWLVRG